MWVFLIIGIFIGMAAYVAVAQTDKTAASVAEEIKQDVLKARYELD